MNNKTDICNLALTYMGQKTITTLTEQTKIAQTCNILFDVARDAVLKAHPWNFARKIEALSTLDEDAVAGWNYLYAYPANALYIIKMFSDPSTVYVGPSEFKEVISVESATKAIAADITPAYAEYIEKSQNVQQYDSEFCVALAYRLASELSQPLTGDSALGQKLYNLYVQTVDQARLHNASAGLDKKKTSSSYEDVR